METWKVEISGSGTAQARDVLQSVGVRLTSVPAAGTLPGRGTGVTACVEADDGADARHRVEQALAGVDGVSVGQAARDRP